MNRSSTYDFIIAGAGASGLSLLWYLLHSDKMKSKSILLIDQSLQPSNDKTWCFWNDHNLPDKSLIYHTWNTLEVLAYNDLFSEKLSSYKYHCMRSVDYTRAILSLAKKHSNVTLKETSITQFDHSKGKGIVHTGEGKFEADWVFQSVVKAGEYYSNPVDVSLKQHFMGIEIETEKDLFDPDKVMLMDFDTPQDHGVTFFYILPFTARNALIEYTFFTSSLLSDDQYKAGISRYLEKRYDLSPDDYSISRIEKGAIPMEDRRYPATYNPRVINIGTVGGLTKPSTGYTFTRIHQHCREILSALENGREPVIEKRSAYRFRVYDMMLLYLLKTQPETCKTIFHDLFEKNSFDRVLQFLEEDTHPGQEISIFASLPYVPFFKAIFKMKHRIFSGA